MQWNDHYNLSGKHAFIGASSHSWLNYTPEKMQQVYLNSLKKEQGTQLHLLASMSIKNRVKLASLKKALNLFVNDAIGFNMSSEQVLYYSDYCFGTADAIRFQDGELRIHDLKTGDGPVVHFDQLDIYSALFCLEYDVDPKKVTFVERLYQGNKWTESSPMPEDIQVIMDNIQEFDKVIRKTQETLQ